MYILFVILGFLMALVGLFMTLMSGAGPAAGLAMMGAGDGLFGLALIGAACFVGILARMDQASVQNKKLMELIEGKRAKAKRRVKASPRAEGVQSSPAPSP